MAGVERHYGMTGAGSSSGSRSDGRPQTTMSTSLTWDADAVNALMNASTGSSCYLLDLVGLGLESLDHLTEICLLLTSNYM